MNYRESIVQAYCKCSHSKCKLLSSHASWDQHLDNRTLGDHSCLRVQNDSINVLNL